MTYSLEHFLIYLQYEMNTIDCSSIVFKLARYGFFVKEVIWILSEPSERRCKH